MIRGDFLANSQSDFNLRKQQAADALREMSRRATTRSTQTPPQNHAASPASKTAPAGAFLPFNLNSLKLDNDTLLILGILLILSSENTDNLLLLALGYILM